MRWIRSIATLAVVFSTIGVCASTAQCADCGCGYAGCPGPNQCNKATCIEEACWCLGGPCGHCRTHCSWVDGCVDCNYPDGCRPHTYCRWWPDTGCSEAPWTCDDGCCPACPPTTCCACFGEDIFHAHLCTCRDHFFGCVCP